MQIPECARLTMPQNIVEPEFWFMTPWAPQMGKNKVFIKGRRSFKFSGFTIICPRKLSMKLFFELVALFGVNWGPQMGKKLSFLLRVVEASNFQDLPSFSLENYQWNYFLS